MEEWRDAPNRRGYQVSNLGRVRSSRRAAPPIQTQYTTPQGYKTVSVDEKPVKVHRLVLEAFIGPSNLITRHLDGNPANNVLSNLAWGTPAENSADMRVHGTNAMTNKTHCPRNHEYTVENTYYFTTRGSTSRHCRKCRAEVSRKLRAQNVTK